MLFCSTQYCFRAVMLPFLNRVLQQAISNSGILAQNLPFWKPLGSLHALLLCLPSLSVLLKPSLSSLILRCSWATHRKCVCFTSHRANLCPVQFEKGTCQSSQSPEHSGSEEMHVKQKQIFLQMKLYSIFFISKAHFSVPCGHLQPHQ